jgi:segregation and condensation protein A
MPRSERAGEQPTYEVQLPVFSGPLDLLLHLIELQELDITSISLAQVTDQYLSYLSVVAEVAPDDLAEFVAIAARLLLIKSRALLPMPSQSLEEEEDVSQDLVQRLREYRQFKQAAQILRQRDRDGLHAYLRSLPSTKWLATWEPKLDLSGTSLDELTTTLRALLQEIAESETGFEVVPYTITIEDKIRAIGSVLGGAPQRDTPLTFRSLLVDSRSKVEIVVTLLAVLQMIRDGLIRVRQEQTFGEILILPAVRDQAAESTNGA